MTTASARALASASSTRTSSTIEHRARLSVRGSLTGPQDSLRLGDHVIAPSIDKTPGALTSGVSHRWYAKLDAKA
jgi:hypothetical protein